MAHLWMTGGSDEWALVPLDGEAFDLAGVPRRRDPGPPSAAGVVERVTLRRIDDGAWVLVAGDARVSVNGSPARIGMVALADRDAIRLADGRLLFFSTETLARVEPFPATGPRGFCPRCRQAIASGTASVRCPACGIWHHASDEFPCWTYDPRCAACPQLTALDAGFRWTPEDL